MNTIANPKEKKMIWELNITLWKKLVKKVLKQDPESIFKTEVNPGPINEIEFWHKRFQNLEYIYQQLTSPEINSVIETLRENQSTYIASFATLKEEVSNAKETAEDNYK